MPRSQPKTSNTACQGSSIQTSFLLAIGDIPTQIEMAKQSCQALNALQDLMRPIRVEAQFDTMDCCSREDLAALVRAVSRSLQIDLDALDEYSLPIREQLAAHYTAVANQDVLRPQ